MRVADFDFDLPPELIAQTARPRGTSRLMVVDRAAQRVARGVDRGSAALLAPGDLLVVNDTRVFPARLLGRRDPSGGAAEVLLLERVDDARAGRRWCIPGQKLKPGARMRLRQTPRARRAWRSRPRSSSGDSSAGGSCV